MATEAAAVEAAEVEAIAENETHTEIKLQESAIDELKAFGRSAAKRKSVGLAIATTILSYALHRPLKERVMITGEVAINGIVGKIGGVQEKHEAAKIKNFKAIFPVGNAYQVQGLKNVT